MTFGRGLMLAQLTLDEWEKQVKDVLRSWHKAGKLEKHLLTNLESVSTKANSSLFATDPFKHAKALKEDFKESIVTLAPDPGRLISMASDDDPRWLKKEWRDYIILMLLPDFQISEICYRIGLAEGGNYFDEQKKAIRSLAELLRIKNGIPEPEPDPFLINCPTGAVGLDNPLYVVRSADIKMKSELRQLRNIVTIRGPRQVGKTSLLIRGIDSVKRRFGARVVYFDLQSVIKDNLSSYDNFLKTFAYRIFSQLELEIDIVEKEWHRSLPENLKLESLIVKNVLHADSKPLLLAMDEVDRLLVEGFHGDFYALIRTWYNYGAHDPRWNKLSTLMVISTEPYLLIDDSNQSPFNVGLNLKLQDFDNKQVAHLNHLYKNVVSEADFQRFMKLLNGHPYLTRMALYTMKVDEVSWDDFEALAPMDQGPFEQHLKRLGELLNHDTELKIAFKEIIKSNTCSNEIAGIRLMKGGLITPKSGKYYPRCELYLRYFERNL